MHHPTLCAVAVALLSAIPGTQASLYSKQSPVLQVGQKDYDRLIAKSNQTSIVEFYAPWCGHCKNLQPAYEKAAKNLDGLAKVAAVNCDDDANKQFCGSMGVKGFPTLKIVRPRKGGGKPTVEDYNGARTATGIVEAVVDRINNHVQKVTDKDLDKFLSEKNESPKAILFTDKGTTSALMKSIAIDFLDVITVGQVRDKETKAVETFGIEKFPTLVLLPGGDKEAVVYDGELKKPAIVKFLSQAGEPNPDPAPVTAKPKKKKSSPPKSETATSEEPAAPSESAQTQQAPVIVDSVTPIPAINTAEKLVKECLSEKSSTCVLAFVPSTHGEGAKEALDSLSTLAHRYTQGKHKLFPIYEVAKENEAAASLISSLELSGEVELVAINARRGWWRRFEGPDFSHESVASWIDAIRMSEGAKNKLPEGVIGMAFEESKAEPAPEASAEAASDTTESNATEEPETVTPEPSESSDTSESTETKPTDPTAEPETAAEEDAAQQPIKHEEL